MFFRFASCFNNALVQRPASGSGQVVERFFDGRIAKIVSGRE